VATAAGIAVATVGGVTRFAPALVVAAALVLVMTATAQSKATSNVIASGTTLRASHGKVAFVQAVVTRPGTLAARVTATPKQRVKLQWETVCATGTSVNAAGQNPTARRRVGTRAVETPAVLKLVVAYADPASCDVVVYSTLSTAGTQRLELVQG
jgi:hypothetical protein